MNLFHEPGCTCPSPAQALTAALNETTIGPCPTHDPDAHARAEAKATADDEFAKDFALLDLRRRGREALDEMVDNDQRQADRQASIDAIDDPLYLSFIDLLGMDPSPPPRPTSSGVPLNSSSATIAQHLGMGNADAV
jgi:hypothetical protein